ncbi:hypothetical protein [Paraburkholderia dipogonis]|uniref:hypothetical protein n=1 Tax=Paraburkholderia dipogonis TaxID=1211383 RepID=UPI0038B81920
MSLNDRLMPFIAAAFDTDAEVRPGNERHFLVTRAIPTRTRPNRFAREIIVSVERDVEREILAATDEQIEQIIGPRIQRAIPPKLQGYLPEEQNHEPFLVIIGMESIGR